MHYSARLRLLAAAVISLSALAATACLEPIPVVVEPAATDLPFAEPPDVEYAQVVDVIDGDTIDVLLEGEVFRVRYIGINTPELDDPCYAEATAANASFVEGQTVAMLSDTSDTDQYGRLLRYVYVGENFVNEELIAEGWAEAVLYPPDDYYWEHFVMLEQAVEDQGVGCHPTGIFDDGDYER